MNVEKGCMIKKETCCHRISRRKCEEKIIQNNFEKVYNQERVAKKNFDWISSYSVSFNLWCLVWLGIARSLPFTNQQLQSHYHKIQWIANSMHRIGTVHLSHDLTTYWKWQNYGDCHKKKFYSSIHMQWRIVSETKCDR